MIPANRINPVAKAVSQFFPKVASGTSSTASLIDRANQATGKVEHRWSDKFTTTGFYGWYDSVEPEARFYAKNLGENPGEPAEGQLFRTVHAVAINNIITTSNNTVFAFRYGYTQFVDNDIPNQFDPGTLGFSQNFLSAIPYKKFPRFAISGYGTVNFDTFGDRDPQDTTFYGHSVNASVSKLLGTSHAQRRLRFPHHRDEALCARPAERSLQLRFRIHQRSEPSDRRRSPTLTGRLPARAFPPAATSPSARRTTSSSIITRVMFTTISASTRN